MGLLELFVVLGFALAWGAAELVGLRIDRKKAEAKAREAAHQAAEKDGTSIN